MDIVKLIEAIAEHAPALLGWGVAAALMIMQFKKAGEEVKTTEKVLEVVKSNTDALSSFRTLLEERVPRGGS